MRWLIRAHNNGLAAAVEAFYPTGMALAAAQGVSLADATVLDRIAKGWKPDQFVNSPVLKFIQVMNSGWSRRFADPDPTSQWRRAARAMDQGEEHAASDDGAQKRGRARTMFGVFWLGTYKAGS